MERQIFPEIKIITFNDIASFIGRLARGGVPTPKTGAAEMLDQQLDSPIYQPELPFDYKVSSKSDAEA